MLMFAVYCERCRCDLPPQKLETEEYDPLSPPISGTRSHETPQAICEACELKEDEDG